MFSLLRLPRYVSVYSQLHLEHPEQIDTPLRAFPQFRPIPRLLLRESHDMPSAYKSKGKGRDARQSHSRNTTPSGAGAPTIPTLPIQSYMENDVTKLIDLANGQYADVLDLVAAQSIPDRSRLKRETEEDDEIHRGGKLKKRKERASTKEDRPLNHGAHEVARQDGAETKIEGGKWPIFRAFFPPFFSTLYSSDLHI